jgi:hypothetical protein
MKASDLRGSSKSGTNAVTVPGGPGSPPWHSRHGVKFTDSVTSGSGCAADRTSDITAAWHAVLGPNYATFDEMISARLGDSSVFILVLS